MNVLILVGKRRTPEGAIESVGLYCGTDGVALAEAAEKAAETKSFYEIGKIVNPSVTPMPIVPSVIKQTTPVFPRLKAKEHVKVAKGTKHIEDLESDLARQRLDRFKQPQLSKSGELIQEKQPSTPREDGGPTINEYVARGYAKENYPPAGFAAKDEAFDQAKVDAIINADNELAQKALAVANERAELLNKEAEAKKLEEQNQEKKVEPPAPAEPAKVQPPKRKGQS